MIKFSGGTSRLGACLQGLFVSGIAMAFVVGGAWTVYNTAHEAATWGTCKAVVTKVTGGDTESDRITVAYRYAVAGKEYNGELIAEEENKREFAALKQYTVGQTLSVRYDPAAPATSKLSATPDALGLAFMVFALPFLLLGVNSLWFGLSGREIVASSQPNAQSSPDGHHVPMVGGGLFFVFVLICVAGAAAQVGLSIWLPWPGGLFTGLAILLGFVPGATWFAVSRGRAWQQARNKKAAVPHACRADAAVADGPEADEAEGEEQDREVTAAAAGSLGKKLAIAAGVTLFWCGITGVFLGFVVYTFGKSMYARQHFLPAKGVVLFSKVTSHSDKDGSSFKPLIRYRYRVGDQPYTSEQYSYGAMGSSDAGYARAAVAANPKGKEVTVFYDPDHPAEAVLSTDVPGLVYFLVLFLQPFLLVGLVMIAWNVTLPWLHGRVVRFLGSEPSLPWTVPTWGTAREDFDGIHIRKAHRLAGALGHFMLGYGLTCFAEIFIVGILFGGFSDPRPAMIGRALEFAAAVGVLAAGRKLFAIGGATVRIDPVGCRLYVQSRLRDEQISFAEIGHWQLRQIRYPSGMTVNGQTLRYLLLEVKASDGRTVPVHAFKPQAGMDDQSTAIARKTQQGLAALTGGEVRRDIISDDIQDTPAPADPKNPVEAVSALAGVVRRWRSGPNYSDLT